MVEPKGERLVECPHFRVDRWEMSEGDAPRSCGTEQRFAVFTVVKGEFECGGFRFTDGSFFLAPAGSALDLRGHGTILRTTL